MNWVERLFDQNSNPRRTFPLPNLSSIVKSVIRNHHHHNHYNRHHHHHHPEEYLSSWIVNHLHLNPAQPPLPSPLTEIGQLGWGKVDLFEFLTTIAVIIIRGILAILKKKN